MGSHFPTFRRWFSRPPREPRTPTPFATVPRAKRWPLRTKRTQRQALLQLLAVGIESGVPLAPLLDAWASDERGVQSNRIRRLVYRLFQGVSLPEVAEESTGALKSEEILAIRFGTQSGTLAASLRGAAESLEPPSVVEPSIRRTVTYLLAFSAVASLVTAFFMIKVVPAFQAIFDDFSMDLSTPMILSIDLANLFVRYWYLIALALIFLAWGIVSFRGSGIVGALVDRLSGGVRTKYAADLLRKLSLVTRAGRPLTGAISTLARYHFDPAMRQKLLFVRNEVEHGADPWQSMTDERLIDEQEAAALVTADRLGNRPWVLRELASAKSRRANRKWQIVAQLALPVVVLGCGAFILLQAVAVVSTLARLVMSLA
jgi:type II secretory pathway component PulF